MFMQMIFDGKDPDFTRIHDIRNSNERAYTYKSSINVLRREQKYEYFQGINVYTGAQNTNLGQCYLLDNNKQLILQPNIKESPVNIEEMLKNNTDINTKTQDAYKERIYMQYIAMLFDSGREDPNEWSNHYEVIEKYLTDYYGLVEGNQRYYNCGGSDFIIVGSRTTDNVPIPMCSSDGYIEPPPKTIACQFYGGERSKSFIVSDPRDPVTYDDYFRNPGAQPIYHFGAFYPLNLGVRLNNVNYAAAKTRLERIYSTDRELNTDMGYDFPRIDSDTFTFLLNGETIDYALFFFQYMNDNYESMRDKFVQNLFNTPSKLQAFCKNFKPDDNLKNSKSTFICEHMVNLTGNEDFIKFYENYKKLGNCKGNSAIYKQWLEQNYKTASGADEPDVMNAKLYRCYKVLNALNGLLKRKYMINRLVRSV